MSERVSIDAKKEVKCYYFFITCSNGHTLQIPADPKWEIAAIGFIQFKCLTCNEIVTFGYDQAEPCAGGHIP